jgi:rfaE bifunctional protein kinase chain/domain/rfaE bifunctional protein nucleotidyltransferase chain/domain
MVSSSSREAGRAAAKIFPDLAALAVHVDSLRAAGKRIVLAHGVFDLLHVGHIRHLREAREQGDVLVVTLTEDRHVNKGPNRPAFTESLRAEALAALEYVDAVTVNRTPTAIDAINALRPDVYVKGPDYKQPAQDVTGGIAREADAVLAAGGVLHITEDLTFSSSALINRYLPSFTADVEAYLASFRGRHSAADVVAAIDKLRDMRVVVIGETILDEYVYVDQMGKSAKDPVLAMRYNKTETYPGGALAVANHLAEFCHSVELITYLGSTDDHEKFVRSNLKPKIRANFIYKSDSPTIVKRRYVEATLNSKLFEVYVINDDALNAGDDADLCAMIDARVQSADAIVCADFGHGLISPTAKQRLGACGRFLAVNTQINAANIRYHAISSYARADYVCINEGELRLDARNRHDGVHDLVRGLAGKLACERFMVTRGSQGVMYYDGASAYPSPSLTTRVLDRIGSGDAVLALTSVGIAAGMPADIVAFFANVIGAQAVEIMGNRSSIGRVQTLKFIDALLK